MSKPDLGIIGGGQLGSLLASAAKKLNIKTVILSDDKDAPAINFADEFIYGEYNNRDKIYEFAGKVDIITYEFENIPTTTLDILEEIVPIRPGREALRVSQDRIIEKNFLSNLGLETAPYQAVEDLNSLYAASKSIGFPAVLKTTRLGYDGKGQIRLSESSNIEKEYKKFENDLLIYEGFVDFEFELSVIAARNLSGQVACYDPGQNVHINGILHSTTIPSQLNSRQTVDAVLIAGKILESLNYVGVLGVELFYTKSGLIVNEIAPRVHNSGHWTQNGCTIDQFEQHIRAITNWPLGDGKRNTNVVMENLIGDEIKRAPALAMDGNISLHLYGKTDVKPGRKMGHFNLVKEK